MTEPASDPPEPTPSPYRGLRPYEEADAAFFFGREAEGENVEANLFSIRLTLLYGPSGVGKSSVLLARVTGSLRKRAREDLEGGAAALFAVVVVRSWSDADPLQTVAAETRRAVTELLADDALPDPPAGATLAEVLDHWSVQVHGKLLVLLDQFEEYFLYHGQESGPGTFDHEFPQAVNRADLRANFLVSIRDDALAQLDRFKGRIPSLFDNRLQIEHLTVAAARDAVKKPIEEYNRHIPAEQQVEIEEELVNDVLDQVRTDRVTRESVGAGTLREGPPGEARVETPILQVVLTALWDREAQLDSRTLRAQTFRDMGGATQLVGDRLNERMGRLSASEQDVAAEVARYLVTPSKTKIALTAADLAQLAYQNPELAASAQARIESVLQKLAEGDTRILRPVEPLGGQGATRYELFHDVLAEPILEWRREHEQERAAQRARRRRLVVRLGVAALLVLVAVFAGLTAYALKASSDARHATERAKLGLSVALASAASAQPKTQLDTKLLLSLEAERARDTAQARSSMIDALDIAGRLGAAGILRTDQSPIDQLAFTRDGRTLATVGRDGKVVLWDAADGYRRLPELPSDQHVIDRVAFSPDGRVLATANSEAYEGKVVLWDASQDHRKLATLESGDFVDELSFSPDGRTLAAASGDQVVLWDAGHDYRKLPALDGGAQVNGVDQPVNSVAFSPDGRTVAATSAGQVVLWDAANGYRKLRALDSGQDYVNGFAFSPDRRTLAVTGESGKVVLWDAAHDYRKLAELDSGQDHVNGVAFSPDGRTLAVTGSAGQVVLLDATRDYRKLATLDNDQRAIYSIVFSPDGRVLAAGGDGTVVLWDAAHDHRKPQALDSGQKKVYSVAFSADGRTLAAAGSTGKVLRWDAAHDYRKLPALDSGQRRVYRVAFSPDGRTLAVTGTSGKVVLWDAAHGYRKLPELDSGQDHVNGVAFSPDGRTLAAAAAAADGDAGMVVRWDAAHDYRRLPVLESSQGPLVDVAFSPDGSTLAAAAWDSGAVVLWDAARKYRKLPPLDSGAFTVYSVAFSPDGRTLAAACNERKVVLWDAAHNYRRLRTLDSGQDDVYSVVFSPEGRTLAAAGSDGKIPLWDATRDFSELTALDSGERTLYTVAFSPDGPTLAAAGGHRRVLLWDVFWLDFADLKARVCGLVHGNLTHTEWETVAAGLPYSTTCPN